MSKIVSDKHTAEGSSESTEVYRKPRLRRIKLAAEEVLTTGCKMAGTCDLPFDPVFNPNPTGAGS